jgi:hypothetical protein
MTGPQINLYQQAMNTAFANAAKAMQSIMTSPLKFPSEPPYEGSRAGWYPSRPPRLNARQRAAQRAGGHLHARYTEQFEGRAGGFAPSCLHCGVGEMQPFRGGFVCDRCGTTSGAV